MQNTSHTRRYGDMPELARQLSHNSRPYRDPLVLIDWTALERPGWWLPEEMLSLHGVAGFAALPRSRRQRLAVAEFVHFARGGLWLEALFMERLARAAQTGSDAVERHIYQLHELREEAGHSLMFLEAIRLSGMTAENNAYARLRLARLTARHVPFRSPLFWASVLLGEEVADRFSRQLRRHRETINPAIHQLVSIHLMDEARHITHARALVREQLATLPAWRRALLRRIIAMLFRRFQKVFYYPPAAVYASAGLDDAPGWARQARTNPHRHAFVAAQVRSIGKIARDIGILP